MGLLCHGLCGLPRSAPRRLRLPKQHHAVFTLATPPRTHGRRAARPHLQSPHGRRRTAAAMRPVARDPRHVRRNRPNLGGVEVVAETLQHIYRVTDAHPLAVSAAQPRGVRTRRESHRSTRGYPSADPSGSSGGSSRQDVLSGSTGGPAASRASCRYRRSTPVDSAPPARFTRCA